YSYTPYTGSPELLGAIRAWYARCFGVELADENIVLLPGSKGGLSRVNLALADPGEVAILPDPAFPSYWSSALVAGLEAHRLVLEEERGWHPDLAKIPAEVARRARFILLNYPNNPTGAATTENFLAELLDWARRTGTLVVYDNAYQFITFDDYRPLSILSLPGAIEAAVEFHTFSKAYGMAGVRIAFAAGHPQAIAALKKIEVYYQAGIFAPSLAAAAVALNEGDRAVAEAVSLYAERREAVLSLLDGIGWPHEKPAGATYFWLKLPGEETDDVAFCRRLVEKTGVILTPGSAFGEAGRGRVRLSITQPRPVLERALGRMAEVLGRD
ncbi:MAG TPA: aminotransferase class I/II-fold pyridoxal phosphate-dependent enzyme, partial [Candidatus Coatesbacteria bacterium]|nr:aminotransferase class I/II-fold pyridoxal phosphate-dependent enzyme [Candidatus Coatesbacteria bacterium]